MRLLSLLSFYDEPVELLALHVDGLALAGVSHLVAADGRYELFAAAEDVSPPDQRGVLDAACRHHGIGLTTLVPQGPWGGGEVQKRTALFALALAVSDPDDWWLNADTDMVITKADGVPGRLAMAAESSALAQIVDVMALRADRADWEPRFPMRCLFRAQPLECRGNHYSYWNPATGAPVWSGTDPRGLDEPLDLTSALTVEHRPHARSPGRRLGQSVYYTKRDMTGLEMGQCGQCGERQAVARVAVGLRLVEGGDGQRIPAGQVNELCEVCGGKQEEQNRRRLVHWGFDPHMPFNERYALPKPRA